MQKFKRLSDFSLCWATLAGVTVLLAGCDIQGIWSTLERRADDYSQIKHEIKQKPIRYNVFYGDLHNHSNISDGDGTPEDAYKYARNTANLDFFSLADHGWGFSRDEWNELKRVADFYNEDGLFTAFWGFEWSSFKGHVTVIGTEDFCHRKSALADTFIKLCNWLSTLDGVAYFNHPFKPGNSDMFDGFNSEPSEKFIGMELWNSRRGFKEIYYNDGIYENDNNRSYYDEALFRGWKIGALGSGDNHGATWGTSRDFRMAVLAPELTREAIMAALKTRRFYSTLDKNLILSFKINDREMGSTVTGNDLTMKIEVSDEDYESFTEVVVYNSAHDTANVWDLESNTVELAHTLSVETDDYFYVKVRQEDGDEAISSPIWVIAEP